MYTYDDESDELASSNLGVQDNSNVKEVFVLQDLDMEHQSPDELISFIEKAAVDVDTITDTHSMVMESILSGDREKMKPALEKARLLRKNLSYRYGTSGCRLVAVENIRTSSVTVFALEEEAEEEVGFIRRILRSIANAFKWLWKKLTGVFSSGEKKEEAAEESLKKAEEVVKNATPETFPDKGDTIDLSNVPHSKVLDWLEKSDDGSGMVKKIHELENILKNSMGPVDELNHLGRYISMVFHSMRTGAVDELAKLQVQIDEKFAKIISAWPDVNRKDVEKEISDLDKNAEILRLNGYTHLPSSRGFLAISYKMESLGFVGWKTYSIQGILPPVEKVIKKPVYKDLPDLLKTCESLDETVKKLRAKTAKLMDMSSEIDKNVNLLIDQKFTGETEDAAQRKVVIKNVVSSILTTFSRLCLFYTTLPNEGFEASEFLKTYLLKGKDPMAENKDGVVEV